MLAKMSPLRAAVLFHRIGPYHFARLRAASSVFHLAAIEYSKEDSTYAWDEVSGSNGFTRVTLDCGCSGTVTVRIPLVFLYRVHIGQPARVCTRSHRLGSHDIIRLERLRAAHG